MLIANAQIHRIAISIRDNTNCTEREAGIAADYICANVLKGVSPDESIVDTNLERARKLIRRIDESIQPPDYKEARLFYIELGDKRIPILTDMVGSIRRDMMNGDEDCGEGNTLTLMSREVFDRVCNIGEIKLVKGIDDLPRDIRNWHPYSGGSVSPRLDISCEQICKMMDGEGIVNYRELP
jgi:hypothetical protein